MHIELTDHLRCPGEHEEAYLILLPGQMAGRRVVTGDLACPICGWQTHWDHAIPDFGGETPAASTEASLPAEALPAMLGLEGAGGWIALAGNLAAHAAAVAALLPGVGIVAVNPPLDLVPDDAVQVIRSPVWPLKTHALRGAAFGPGATAWRDAMLGSVLPGRHLIGVGPTPAPEISEILAEAGSVWVARTGTTRR